MKSKQVVSEEEPTTTPTEPIKLKMGQAASPTGDVSPGGDERSTGSDEPFDVSSAAAGSTSPTRSENPANEADQSPPLTSEQEAEEESELPDSASKDDDEDKQESTMLSSGRRTVRPLSPPSRAGLANKEVRDDQTDDEEDLEDMPMDERSEYIKQQALLCGVDEGVSGDDNLCDYTLSALGDMCGIGPEYERKAQGSKKSSKDKSKSPYGVEEQTAIEVEYVERRQDAKSDVSRGGKAKKNMLVQAMARRAKKDFESNQKGKPSPERSMGAQTSPPSDNVYSSFSSSEKRKFLKLINSGLTPGDATQQVLQERQDGDKSVSDSPSSKSGGSGKARLSYWKRGEKDDRDGAEDSPKESQVGEDFAKSGINYYDAVRKENEIQDSPERDAVASPASSKKSKKKTRFGRFGFARMPKEQKGKSAARDPPPGSAPEDPATPPRPINTARDSDKEEYSRSVFKPIAAGAAVGATAAVVDSDDDSLLRDDDDDRIAAQILGKPKISSRSADPLAELDVETTYMHSTELMSQYGGAGASMAGDQTVTTYKTSGTTGTNYTTSTRSRRPGAVVQRLTSQKTGETTPSAKKYKGWQESIQEVAAGIDRTWDPSKGWVDYIDPDAEANVSDEKIPELESEANIVAARAADMRTATAPELSHGWVESMKKATARINTEGRHWDPERGWVGLEDEERAASEVEGPTVTDTQDFGTTSEPRDRAMPLPTDRPDPPQHEDASVQSGAVNGRYVQIGDSGSVRSFYYGKPSDGTKPTREQRSSLLVDVKKEKMSEEDANMFPGLRRGDGPVDVDEDDENSFGRPADFSWDETTNASSTLGGAQKEGSKTAPNFKIKNRGSSEASYGSGQSIPKLRGPKRDTSPIRAREFNAVGQPESPSMDPSGLPPQAPGHNRSMPSPLKTPKQSPGRFNDTRSTYTAESSPSVASVRSLHDYWERRSNGEITQPDSAEWKSFLAKKVMAEKAAVAGDEKPRVGTPPNAGGMRSLEEISDISPIHPVHDDKSDEDDEVPSEASTAFVQGTTFMQRLQACAAPIMPKTTVSGEQQDGNCNSIPMAHLAFLRSNPAASGETPGKFVPPNLCGRPDVIIEEEEDVSLLDQNSARGPRRERSRSKSNPKPRGPGSDVGSVISEEQFGAKSAYLESIAMKAAVSGSKKLRRSRGSGSEVSAASSGAKHSESWQRFMDKKKATKENEGGGGQGVTKAAERFAMEKVEQMMGSLASRNRSEKSDLHNMRMEDSTGAFPRPGPGSTPGSTAAEDLAAARVEAMMEALSTTNLDEGEGEI